MLRSVPVKGVYKSDRDNILEDFYLPALSVAISYDRAVGFFSGSTISYAAQALSAFIANGGTMRLIVGAFADARDVEAVRRGEDHRALSQRLGDEFLAVIDESGSELFQERFRTLAWLVAERRLDIKVALRPRGMYHDKIGIITDATGDAFVFAGSANESAQALLPTHNYESIDVFPTWRPELEEYFSEHIDSFARLWENRSRGSAVMDVPTALNERLLEVASRMDAPPDPAREAAIARRLAPQPDVDEEVERPSGPRLPSMIGGVPFAIRQHQRDTLNAWRERGAFCGIFDLATGAGKTITACYAMVQMAGSIPGLTVVIAVPYQNLADQWCDILEQFGIDPVRCYMSKAGWTERLYRTVHEIEMAARAFAAVVVVNRTLKSFEFQAAITRVPGDRLLWIADECHHHSSESFARFLPEQARYRIGLSATPEHYLDTDRNARLAAYYGETVFTYTLGQAIADGVLTPYDYYPHIVELTDDEADEFVELSNDIARAFAREASAASKSMGLTALLMRRARVIGSAANKMPALAHALHGAPPRPHTLFYCGDGNVEGDTDDVEEQFSGRQIEVVSRQLDRLGWRISRFTSREPRRERNDILANFKIGLIDAMVAIKCLDEGIDVPACDTAYILASSRDPRQFIQRRGRILRRSPGKDHATIHDFVTVLPANHRDGEGHARKLIQSELRRVAEFNTLARNASHAYDTLRPILTAYDLEHVL
ncbi:MAG: DEAD/DEAH box helicase family protein [Vicinamibacterales bacterium]